MVLNGSCHCGGVRFKVESPHAYPFNLCYCTICRKTAGGGGFAINLGGLSTSLEVEGEANITVYQVRLESQSGEPESAVSPCERRFCRICGSALWVWDPRWPDLIHPFASAVDSELPMPPERTHLMLEFKAQWVAVNAGENDKQFAEYPDESLAQWHRRLGFSND